MAAARYLRTAQSVPCQCDEDGDCAARAAVSIGAFQQPFVSADVSTPFPPPCPPGELTRRLPPDPVDSDHPGLQLIRVSRGPRHEGGHKSRRSRGEAEDRRTSRQ